MDVTKQLAQFVVNHSFSDVPPDVVGTGKAYDY